MPNPSGAALPALAGRSVLVTGHNGFKGSWLSWWLHLLDCEVHGASLAPAAPGAAGALSIDEVVTAHPVDVRDRSAVSDVVRDAGAEVVFHLAAQPIVRRSWEDPIETFASNVMGTVHVLDAALRAPNTRGVVIVTTDKVYENRGTGEPFVETDRLGGHDPYSASKAAAELAVAPYRSPGLMGARDVPVVTVRAGNVIGGWDRSADRLVPDAVRALESGQSLVLRRPEATRPWQHVLDCLWGYLSVADRLVAGEPCPPALNLAHWDGARTVLEVARAVGDAWGAGDEAIEIHRETGDAEAQLLQLDASLARSVLGWRSPWTTEEAIDRTVEAYRAADPRAVATAQIERFLADVERGSP